MSQYCTEGVGYTGKDLKIVQYGTEGVGRKDLKIAQYCIEGAGTLD